MLFSFYLIIIETYCLLSFYGWYQTNTCVQVSEFPSKYQPTKQVFHVPFCILDNLHCSFTIIYFRDDIMTVLILSHGGSICCLICILVHIVADNRLV